MKEPARVVFLSNHVYGGAGRKASIHFIAGAMSRMGMNVSFVTVGASMLVWLRTSRLNGVVRHWLSRRWFDGGDGVNSYVVWSLVHLTGSNSFLSRAINFLGRSIGAHLPASVSRRIRTADLIVFDSGSSVLYYELVARLCPGAKKIYNAADLLSVIGVSSRIMLAERSLVDSVDFVRAPSPRILNSLRPKAPSAYIPHGIDKEAFDRCNKSPYGDRPAMISVGSTLLDDQALVHLAASASEYDLHSFGAPRIPNAPDNLIQHPETPFSGVVPFIKYARIGIAAYRPAAETQYLAESSLKLLQYEYCGLPVLVPASLSIFREGVYAYDENGTSHEESIALASAHGGQGRQATHIRNWDEVAATILGEVGIRWSRQADASTAPGVGAGVGGGTPSEA